MGFKPVGLGDHVSKDQAVRAEIDARGRLIVFAETELESYALTKWHDGYKAPSRKKRTESLVVVPINGPEDKLSTSAISLFPARIYSSGTADSLCIAGQPVRISDADT